MPTFKIAIGDSAYSNKIRVIDVTFEQMIKKFNSPKVQRQKDGPYFVFASIKNGIRNAQNVEEYFGATIDLDDTPLTLEQIQSAFSRYRYIIHTTYNHQNEEENKGDRYRLILPYAHPLNIGEHTETLFHIMDKLGFDNVDLSTKAISRPMYLPSYPKARRSKFQCIVKNTGRFFRVKITAEMRFRMQEILDDHSTTEKFDINKEAPDGDRNNSVARLVGKFIHNGMDMNTIMQSTKIWNESNCSPPLDDSEVEVIVNSVYKAHKRNNSDTGWGYDEILRRVKESMDCEADFDILTQLIATCKCKRSQQEILARTLAKKSKLPIAVVKEEIKNKALTSQEIEEEEDEEKEQLSAKHLRKEFKSWVYISRDDRVYNSAKGMQYKVEGFNRSFQSMVDKGAMLNLLLKYHCIQTADMMQFHPGEEQLFTDQGIRFANTYRASDVIPSAGSVHPMLRHMRYLIPDAKERNTLLDYIAFLIQRPGEKVLWMPVIKGKKGIGKSIIVEKVITPLLGHKNVNPVESKKVASDFNAWKLDTQLVVFHELKLGETRKERLELTEAIKDVITGRYMLASKKGIDDYQTPNRLNMLGLTNHEDAIMITIDERRFYMIRSDVKPKSRQYYAKIVRWCEKHESEMLEFFLSRDIADFNYQTAPFSEYTQEVKGSSLLWPESILTEALTDKNHIFTKEAFTTWGNIVEYIRSESTGRDAIMADSLVKATSSSGYKLNNALREYGFRKWTTCNGNARLRISGKLETVFACPHIKDPSKFDITHVKDIITKQKCDWEFTNG